MHLHFCAHLCSSAALQLCGERCSREHRVQSEESSLIRVRGAALRVACRADHVTSAVALLSCSSALLLFCSSLLLFTSPSWSCLFLFLPFLLSFLLSYSQCISTHYSKHYYSFRINLSNLTHMSENMSINTIQLTASYIRYRAK